MTRLSRPSADVELAVDGVPLLPGVFVTESRKRLPCDGGCGHTFASNREWFLTYRRVLRASPKPGRYCLDCARDQLSDRCPVPAR